MTSEKYLMEEYRARINRVIDFIEQHIDDNLTLDKLAQIANFSKYHFHRIFGNMVGEPLYQFIQRIRIERAAFYLVNNPKKSITEIAFDCGFSSSAAFARVFKEFFKKSATEYRQDILHFSNIGKANSKNEQQLGNYWKDYEISSMYIDSVNLKQTWRIKMKKESALEAHVQVKELSEMTVAYIRHIGPYKGNENLFENLFNKLMKWAGPRGLLENPEVKCFSVYHDDPEITEDSKLRTSVCLTIPQDMQVDGEVGKMTISGGKYAVAHFEINGDQYQDAWNALYGGWLPESGYQPDDKPSFEMYLNNPKEHPQNKHIVDICVPIKPL